MDEEAVMKTAKVKRPSTHYLLVGSAVAGAGFLDRDGKTIVLRLAKGISLSWRDRRNGAIAFRPHHRNGVLASD
jgi:hypothetical protein